MISFSVGSSDEPKTEKMELVISKAMSVKLETWARVLYSSSNVRVLLKVTDEFDKPPVHVIT